MTFELNKILRKNIKELSPYSSARSEYAGEAEVYLDANESPYNWGSPQGLFNRYPDPTHQKLRNKIASIKNVPRDCVFTANGSDEIIDLLIRAFCKPGADRIITLNPSYGVYKVAAQVNDIYCDSVPLDSQFSLDLNALFEAITEETRLIFLCSPNNPTGNNLERQDMLKIVKNFDGLVIVDEAYIDFSSQPSLVSELWEHPNLVVMQTLSKAWGLAGLRIGMAFSSQELCRVLDRMKSPYNMSVINQEAALSALSTWRRKEQNVRISISERERLRKELLKFSFVEEVFPSEANFLLVKIKDADKLFKKLLLDGIVLRNRSYEYNCENCLRITIGTPEENNRLIEALENFSMLPSASRNREAQRKAEVSRSTSETSVYLRLLLDANGEAQINSKIPFLNHMLELFAFHASVDLRLDLEGDLEVDSHHSIEDLALCLGQAFRKAMGSQEGIERYGYVLPMDESLAFVAIDLSGRPFCTFDAAFRGSQIGDLPTEMLPHFFNSFASASRCTVHIKATGKNDHHICEAIFKAFGRALKAAANRDSAHRSIPSSKGLTHIAFA